MLDGRVWYLLQKQGVSEKRNYTDKQAEQTRDRISEMARKAGWVK